jgi:hypothetical protein
MSEGPRPLNGHDEPPFRMPPATPNPFSNSHPGFGGTFVTEDSVLSGSLEFKGSRLIMWGGGNPLLAWGPGECVLERLTANRFVLTADGETITFTADDPDALDDVLSQHSFGPFESASNGSAMPSIAAAPVVPLEEELDQEPVIASTSEVGARPTRPELFRVPDPAPEPLLEPELPEPELPETRRLEVAKPEPVQTIDAVAAPPTDTAIEDLLAAPIKGRRPFIKSMKARAAEGNADTDELTETVETEGDEGVTIADLALTTAKKLKRVRPRRWIPNDLHTVAIKVGLVSGAVVVVMGFAFAVLLILGGGEAAVDPEVDVSPTTSIVTVPTTVATTVPPPPADLETPVFDLTSAEFAERWNVLAANLDEALLLSPNISSPFSLVMTPYMTFDGILNPLEGSLRLRATPTGTADGDRRILVAIALVIGTAEPSLTPDQRGQLVEELGLDLQDTDLSEISGARTYNGLHYEMDFLEAEGVLQFLVRPEGAVEVTSTTAAP